MKFIIVLLLYSVNPTDPGLVDIEEIQGTKTYNSETDCESKARSPEFRSWVIERYIRGDVYLVEIKCRPVLPGEVPEEIPA